MDTSSKAWTRNNSGAKTQLARPSPYHLRALVLDYLCHNCYTETAKAFARDSTIRHLDPDGDEIMASDKGRGDTAELDEEVLRTVERRKEIQTEILTGRVDEATALLSEYFPSVLSDTDAGNVRPTQSSQDRIEYIASTTVDPTHLSLNLRIQAFIEASRTTPLLYPSPPPHQPSRSPSAPYTLYEHDTPEFTDIHQTELLHRAQKLYHDANTLQNPNDRATYLKELGNVGGLLAYRVPEESPMAKYLSQERRQAVADQINSAILYRTGRAAVSQLELGARYTSALWNVMHDLHVRPTSLTNCPLGVSLIPLSDSRKGNLPSTKSSSNPDSEEPVPGFDLHQFLNSKI